MVHNCMDCPKVEMLEKRLAEKQAEYLTKEMEYVRLLGQKDHQIGRLNEEISDLKNSIPILNRLVNAYEKCDIGYRCVGKRV